MSNLFSDAASLFKAVIANELSEDAQDIDFCNAKNVIIKSSCIISTMGTAIDRSSDGIMVEASYREYRVVFMPNTSIPELESEFVWQDKAMQLVDIQDYHGQYIGYAIGHG